MKSLPKEKVPRNLLLYVIDATYFIKKYINILLTYQSPTNEYQTIRIENTTKIKFRGLT